MYLLYFIFFIYYCFIFNVVLFVVYKCFRLMWNLIWFLVLVFSGKKKNQLELKIIIDTLLVHGSNKVHDCILVHCWAAHCAVHFTDCELSFVQCIALQCELPIVQCTFQLVELPLCCVSSPVHEGTIYRSPIGLQKNVLKGSHSVVFLVRVKCKLVIGVIALSVGYRVVYKFCTKKKKVWKKYVKS